MIRLFAFWQQFSIGVYGNATLRSGTFGEFQIREHQKSHNIFYIRLEDPCAPIL